MPWEQSTASILELFTVGHSTRTITAFVALLIPQGITVLIDVRTIPRSRHNPQFNIETLPKELLYNSIEYMHMKELGGLRRAQPDSPNTGWKNASFQGYADYMQTAEFAAALQKLISVAQVKKTAIMCAEAVPWRCHRSLIADALTIRSIRVLHILSAVSIKLHALTAMAQIDGTLITYPRQPGLL